ncbi:S16 family serine protease [Propionicimonas sp.]|uniref:YlbL family protein n=1 Tax=Propionicimonas sp. TaxID=1955623 RepID=UPI0018440F11|nr:S16 family serine protease [Propionicimonas sp.]MBU3977511.1 PDZ domain-containing protein [Actinomycetota bacterium]MBA3021437.1 PDZ domain-containing protein [Propionicimonas sp.]MBU3986021.1 PDZ domain-containing protein [Actinomycetota bacterium]MBU4008806.1 PDZ domain-containing protein [Actinomycetota bacterium]MBU4066044.1 PDZ domain-containing protein [Actinomycetota bacterium]
MTRQTWTAAISALLFVVLAAVIALVPVPFIAWAPGSTYDLLGRIDNRDAIAITGAPTYPSAGELRMTTISVTAPDSSLSLPEVLISYWMPDRAVLPRVAIYRPGTSATDVDHQESELMSQSQTSAVVAALRATQIDVTEMPMVYSVQTAGPAAGVLKAGDLISAVDAVPVATPEDVIEAVKNRHVGQKVVFTLIRDRVPVQKTVTTRASNATPDTPVVGIDLSIGYSYEPQVSFAVDPSVGGSSAGLMFALAIYDRLTPGELVAGQVIAGTGTMSADGKIGGIGGVTEKIAAAARDKATVFLLPKQNCANVAAVPAGVRLVPVESLSEAIDSLAALADASTANTVPGCS